MQCSKTASLPPALGFFLGPLWWSMGQLVPFNTLTSLESPEQPSPITNLRFPDQHLQTLIILAAIITMPDKGNLKEKYVLVYRSML